MKRGPKYHLNDILCRSTHTSDKIFRVLGVCSAGVLLEYKGETGKMLTDWISEQETMYQILCANCGRRGSEHGKSGKCLFEPTSWDPGDLTRGSMKFQGPSYW